MIPNDVFVLSNTKKPLMPTNAARARQLLRDGKAAVYRRHPFTIILKHRSDGETQPIEAKFDPGSKTTGVALVANFPKQGRVVLFAANLNHRGASIVKRLTDRLSIRRGRRHRNTRYRAPRFLNRTKPKGWLPPSLQSRVNNVKHWLNQLLDLAPITGVAVETVRFDTQVLQDPTIQGTGYQQGTLAGYEVREYLLEKWQRTCAYCGAKNIPLEIEHIVPRSKGGSNRISNQALACTQCNQKKGNQPIEEFLAHDPKRLARIKAQAKAPLRDAAAVNATRYATGNALKEFGLPVSFWSGGRTKKNRVSQGYEKDHWIDAACVGETGENVTIPQGMKPLTITATGRGQRQVVRSNKYGFPRGGAGRVKRVKGFQTGDFVKLTQPKGKYASEHVGRLASIRATGAFDIAAAVGKVSANWKNFALIQRGDGYAYEYA
jgi:5-methylcytosine-specific restriction endonuclease McrA